MVGDRILAIIPARSGSKRLPGKNIKLLNGKPLIQWTIEAALKSTYIDEVLVSTDCDEIITLANKLGGLAPFKRPKELATDTASSVDVALHALSFVESLGEKYTYVVFLQPTSPLRNEKHIDEAIETVLRNNLESCVSVCEAEHSPLWCSKVSSKTNKMDFSNMRGLVNCRSQDLPTFYRLNGAIYIINCDSLREKNQLFLLNNCTPYIMSQESSVDIDNKLDFIVAEAVLEAQH